MADGILHWLLETLDLKERQQQEELKPPLHVVKGPKWHELISSVPWKLLNSVQSFPTHLNAINDFLDIKNIRGKTF